MVYREERREQLHNVMQYLAGAIMFREREIRSLCDGRIVHRLDMLGGSLGGMHLDYYQLRVTQ